MVSGPLPSSAKLITVGQKRADSASRRRYIPVLNDENISARKHRSNRRKGHVSWLVASQFEHQTKYYYGD
jgi:hypothetical protein